MWCRCGGDAADVEGAREGRGRRRGYSRPRGDRHRTRCDVESAACWARHTMPPSILDAPDVEDAPLRYWTAKGEETLLAKGRGPSRVRGEGGVAGCREEAPPAERNMMEVAACI